MTITSSLVIVLYLISKIERFVWHFLVPPALAVSPIAIPSTMTALTVVALPMAILLRDPTPMEAPVAIALRETVQLQSPNYYINQISIHLLLLTLHTQLREEDL